MKSLCDLPVQQSECVSERERVKDRWGRANGEAKGGGDRVGGVVIVKGNMSLC